MAREVSHESKEEKEKRRKSIEEAIYLKKKKQVAVQNDSNSELFPDNAAADTFVDTVFTNFTSREIPKRETSIAIMASKRFPREREKDR